MAYNGKDFHGWQRQPNVPSIQQTIEDKFSLILKNKTILWGCGRTDAGVHASQYFAHLDVEEALQENIVFRINTMLPSSISIKNYFKVPSTLHAQRSAISRSYEYFIHFEKAPFNQGFYTRLYDDDLDMKLLEQAIQLILKATNFRSFCKQPNLYKHTNCHIFDCSIQFKPTFPNLHFKITANRFLRGMIRLLVARLIELGTGRLSLEEFHSYLFDQKELKIKTPFPPNGLFLNAVEYGEKFHLK